MNRKKTTEEFICESNKIHLNKYDYSKTEYIGAHKKVCIICPIHGEFQQEPNIHLRGQGCPECGKEKKRLNKMLTTEEFISKAKTIHLERYDYSKVKYCGMFSKVCIICPEHGEFWQTPISHLNSCGCQKCSGRFVYNTEDFIKKAKKIHNNKYIYSKVCYTDSSSKVCIICPEHGEFWQTPGHHLQGRGCPSCSIKRNAEERKSNNIEFIEKSNKIHNNKYNYSYVTYESSDKKVSIICPKHGLFLQKPNDHLDGHGCPKCGQIISISEDEIAKLFTQINHIQRDRTILNGKEIDIYIPSLKLGIEYNGLRWHSEEFGKDHKYHLDKLNECNKQGIRLIQIFEDEWVKNREICESKLKQICGLNTNPKIFARKCEIREFDKKNKNEAYEFLDKNHIQGRTGFTVALGAYYDGKLVGVMTFKKEKDGFWDLNRFATGIHYQCIGLGGKLFKYFTQNYQYEEIKSFADRRWTTDPNDNLYTKLGFDFDSFVDPTYWYYNQKVDRYRRFHKFGFRKQPLHHQYGLPLTMTEREMTESLGYTRIWDCGLIKYVFKNK